MGRSGARCSDYYRFRNLRKEKRRAMTENWHCELCSYEDVPAAFVMFQGQMCLCKDEKECTRRRIEGVKI